MSAQRTTVATLSRDGRPMVRGRAWVAVGVVGAMALLGGIGGYLALINPPYQQDESSHVGYTLSLREGTLPGLGTPVPSVGGGEELPLALARPYPFSDPDIHVANNPPFPYLVGIPFAEVTRQAGLPGGSLLGIRLLDLAGAVGAVACGFLLGRELSGGDRFVGLITAGLLSSVISVPLVSSLANVDGVAFLTTTAVTWSLARLARTRTSSHALHLGLWCAAAAAVRPMSLAFAAVAGALGLFLCLRTHGWRPLGSFAARLGAPTVVLTGWFYALNVVRYGDPSGSAALFEKYGTSSGPSIWSLLWSPAPFVQTLDYLVTDVYGRDPWWEATGLDKWTVAVVSVGLVAGAVLLAIRASARRSRTSGIHDTSGSVAPGTLRLSAASWGAVAALGMVPMVLIAQHMSGGGAGHPRYLMPALPIVAAAAALVTSIVHRLVSVAVLTVFVVVEVSRIRAAGHLRYGDGRLFGPELSAPIVGQPFRAVTVVLAVAGAVALVSVAAILAIRPLAGSPSSEGRTLV